MKPILRMYLRTRGKIRIIKDLTTITKSIPIRISYQTGYVYEIHILNNDIYRLIKYDHGLVMTSLVIFRP